MIERHKMLIPLVAIAVAACSAGTGGAHGNATEAAASSDTITGNADLATVTGNADLADAAPAVAQGSLKLLAPADAGAIAAVRQAAGTLSDVAVTSAQSFKIMSGGQQIATFVAGEGKAPDAVNAGCFAAIVQNGRATVLPTIGSGAWEAETCLSTDAVGILGASDPVRIAVIYKAASPNAEVLEPVVLQWDRAGRVTIDEAASTRASTAGATSVKAVRELLK
ncbi:hypothetical protein C8J43_10233 [Sphingomonas sp. PP-CE-1G-424]|nr:hypothetical protein C8J43_10233 [Sphingomonas sp. PP-CE-1G-424]